MNLTLSKGHGQCYDGAATMSVSRSGAASRLLGEEKHALYTHCYGHALNLAIGITLKQSKVCCDTMEVAFEITKLIKFSPKRNAAFQRIESDETNGDYMISRVGQFVVDQTLACFNYRILILPPPTW